MKRWVVTGAVFAGGIAGAIAIATIERDRNPPPLLVNSVGMELRYIPAGSFAMGSPPDEPGRQSNEGPVRRVTIRRPYYLAATETTVAQFAEFVRQTGYRTEAERDAGGGFGIDFDTATVIQQPGITWRDPGFPGHRQTGEHPAVLISWADAEAFCEWLSQTERRTYRLPTEAEWEYAARGGTETPYWFGASPESLAATGNVADASLRGAMPAAEFAEHWRDGFAFTAPAGSFEANPFGLRDMHGNVWEWCQDWFSEDAYSNGPAIDPAGPGQGRFRAIRGGGWFNPAAQNRAAQRVYFDPTFRYCLLSGFRVLLETD